MSARQVRAAFMARTRWTTGGHRKWMGWRDHRGVPLMFVGGVRYTAAQAAFLLAAGRPAVGYVKRTCDRAGCVAPEHQADRLMRDELAAEERQRREEEAVDMTAVLLALHGRPPFPPLNPAEKRAGLRLADPGMSTAALARRLGCCRKTVGKRRARRAEVAA